MKKISFKWKSVISVVLAIALFTGGVALIANFASSKTKTVNPGFSVGALDENGEYSKSKTSVYTKKAFSCIGLRIEPDFESDFTYDVFYYDQDMRLVETVEGLSGVYDEDFPLAQYCRILIHPEIPEDFESEEFEIKFYEVFGIASKLKITVNRDQTFVYGDCRNLYNDALSLNNTGFVETSMELGNTFETKEVDGYKVSEKIALEKSFKKVDVFIRVENPDSAAVAVLVTSADEKVVSTSWFTASDMKAGEWCKFTVEIPEIEDDLGLYLRLRSSAECYVFGY